MKSLSITLININGLSDANKCSRFILFLENLNADIYFLHAGNSMALVGWPLLKSPFSILTLAEAVVLQYFLNPVSNQKFLRANELSPFYMEQSHCLV